jgi:hypothetical protein
MTFQTIPATALLAPALSAQDQVKPQIPPPLGGQVNVLVGFPGRALVGIGAGFHRQKRPIQASKQPTRDMGSAYRI